jgi:hypothetical protein
LKSVECSRLAPQAGAGKRDSLNRFISPAVNHRMISI